MRLQDKVALITGGAGSIGRAAATLFAAEGAKVIIADNDAAAAEQAADSLRRSGSDAIAIQVNVADSASVLGMAEEAVSRFGSVDILVNNAGITRDRTLLKMSDEEWHNVIDVNLNGVFYCTRAIFPYMAARGSGKVINTASIVATSGNFGQTNYAASKAGIIGMTKTWAKELGPKGILVNAVAPGFIETPMTDRMPEASLRSLKDKIPLGRLGKSADVASVYLFLASSDSDYVNGTVIEVNGGLAI
jgi:3-oxoacyl-[acyl-carrier protein] reductase